MESVLIGTHTTSSCIYVNVNKHFINVSLQLLIVTFVLYEIY